MGSEATTVRLAASRARLRREAVAVFPRDRAFGAALGQKRWLGLKPGQLFRPKGIVAWGVSDPPPRPPTPAAPEVSPDYSWLHRFTIGGKDELVMMGGFGLHYFRVPRSFEQLIELLETPEGEPLSSEAIEDGFFAIVTLDRDAPADSLYNGRLRRFLLIPSHFELDFSTANQAQELAIEVSGPLDRVALWGETVQLS